MRRLKIKVWKRYIININKKTGVATLITDKVDFRAKTITWDKEGHIIIIKVPIHQEETTFLNIHAFKNIASKYMKQKMHKAKTYRTVSRNSQIH